MNITAHWTGADELRAKQEHFDKYERLARAISVNALKQLVPFSRERIVEALKTDSAMNNLPLYQWDAFYGSVRELVARAGGSKKIGEVGGWSLGNTVCVLKHVARHHIAGVPRP
jgi:hypothetical protein